MRWAFVDLAVCGAAAVGRQTAAKAARLAQSETDLRIPIGVYIPQIFTLDDNHLKERAFPSR
jgi:hypothetical protein